MIDNNWRMLNKKFEWVLNLLDAHSKNITGSEIVIEKSAGRDSTIFVANSAKKVYLHSKYNPYEEAKRIIDHFENIGSYGYVVFLGFVLGYHVEYFTNKFPHIPFSIYEPKLSIFSKCLESRDISFLEKSRLDNFYFGDADSASERKLLNFLSILNCDILVIPLTSYETAFPGDYDNFYKIFGQYFDKTIITDNTKKHNEKLHTVNVLNNFNTILGTPNIMRQNIALFRNKPAVIVSAGPSLEYEIENLKYIKQNDLAYIFSAGSSINTLIDNKIYPHACWSIEPNEQSQKVYAKLISLNIKTVPLIFGSTTSPAIVKSYPGNLYHFITSKDLVSPYYLDNDLKDEEIIATASSIAVVALLALHKLGFSPIILVGQNLSYKDQRYYSKGIDYNQGSGIIDDGFFKHLYKVPSVEGSYVYSDDALNCFRKDMEQYIRSYNINNVINTTRGGAAIKGTSYIPLDELLETTLKDKVVDHQWEQKLSTNYNKHLVKKQSANIKAETSRFHNAIEKLKKLSDSIYDSDTINVPNNLASVFYGIFSDIINNKFFHVFLYSMNTYECKLLIKDIKANNRNIAFSISLFNRFIDFINTCTKDTDIVLPLMEELDKKLFEC